MRSSHHNIARTVTVVGAAAVMTVGGSAGAFAHECFVASRSAQGNAMAGTHSQAWETFTLQQVVTLFLGQSASVADCVAAAAPGAGVPTSFVFGGKQAQGQGGVIAENNPNMSAKGLSSNGTGIDHAEDAYGGAIVGLIIGCGGSVGGPA